MTRPCAVAVVAFLVSTARLHADDFDRLDGPALAGVPKDASAHASASLSVHDLERLPRVLPGTRSAVIVAETGEGNVARLMVSAALRRPAGAGPRAGEPAETEAAQAEPVPILVLERFDTFEGGAARTRLARGREVVLFDGFRYDLDTGQVVPEGQGGDVRFVAGDGGRLEALSGAKLYTLTASPLANAARPGAPSAGRTVVASDFAGCYRLFANGQASGSLELRVEEGGAITGRFRSDQTGNSYPVTGQTASDRPEWAHFEVEFPRSRQEFDGRLWTEGKGAMSGTARLLDREFGFFAIREGGRIVPESALAEAVPAALARPNVVLIAIDDLNDWIGCLKGHPQAQTPHMDRLAARGALFTNAHCQSPLCNPSRTSLLTGLRPTTTGVYALNPWFRISERYKDLDTLPQYFARHGYRTITCGKIYHDAYPPPAGRKPGTEFGVWGYHGNAGPRPSQKFVTTPEGNHPLVDWGVFPERDELQEDWKIADWAIGQLRSKPEGPFFLSVGFRRPHVPCYASQAWFDLYPDASLMMPPVRRDDRDDTPRFSWYLHWTLPEPRLAWLESQGQWRALVRAYLASTSFVDSQVGRVLDAIEANGYQDNTIVVLFSDHGWHLGEKGITGKNSLWDRSTRVPLMFAGPGVRQGASKRPAELLDLYPTLIDVCGLPEKGDLEGHSLAPQLKNADAPRAWPAITSHGPGNHSVRTERYRYIRYADGSEELYDYESDPNEWTNLAAKDELAAVKRELAEWLPKSSTPPLPGSITRLIEVRDGVVYWEGKPIGADDPIP